MSAVVLDAIAASIAAITPIMTTPVEPFGYGSDVSCAYDVDPGVAELDGALTLVLAQAIVRRLDTPRGSLPDDPSYGISLRSMVNKGLDATEIANMAGVIRGEVSKDDRVDTVAVTVTPSTALDAITVTLVVRPVDHTIGGFTMTLAVTAGAVLLEAIA